MTYQTKVIHAQFTPDFMFSTGGNHFPTSFRNVLFSYWTQHGSFHDTVTFENYGNGQPFNLAINYSFGILSAGAGADDGNQILDAEWNAPPGGLINADGFTHVAMSVDAVGKVAQCYVNGVACPVSSITWGPANGPLVNSTPANRLLIEPQWQTTCYADFFLDAPASFFDLSVPANLAKFIDANGNPVSLGANGSLPTGSRPLYFLHLDPSDATLTDYFNNLGSAGAVSPGTATGWEVCSLLPASIIPTTATLAELYFSHTGSFVDLSAAADRRRFISDLGGPVNLASDGAAPLVATPPVFLSAALGNPAQFKANNGRGGAFTASAGTLAAGGSNPRPVVSSRITPDPRSPGRGALGDYRNGNLYAFNPANLTDNGTPHRWLRRWRALPAASSAAARFAALLVDMQTGAGVPDGVTPHVSLRWSDDGGHTWSDERIKAVGRLGATYQTVKFNQLGSTRRFKSSDRIFELSSSDPFLLAILGADVDVS